MRRLLYLMVRRLLYLMVRVISAAYNITTLSGMMCMAQAVWALSGMSIILCGLSAKRYNVYGPSVRISISVASVACDICTGHACIASIDWEKCAYVRCHCMIWIWMTYDKMRNLTLGEKVKSKINMLHLEIHYDIC